MPQAKVKFRLNYGTDPGGFYWPDNWRIADTVKAMRRSLAPRDFDAFYQQDPWPALTGDK